MVRYKNKRTNEATCNNVRYKPSAGSQAASEQYIWAEIDYDGPFDVTDVLPENAKAVSLVNILFLQQDRVW